METYELKPNIVKIATIITATSIYKGNHPSDTTLISHCIYLNNQWNTVLIETPALYLEEDLKLKEILEEYQLEEHYNDFLFLGYYNLKMISVFGEKTDSLSSYDYAEKKRLLSVLQFYYNTNELDIKIEFKHKLKNINIPINEPILLALIKRTLIKYYIKSRGYEFKKKEDEDKNYGEFIDEVIQTKSYLWINKKGRNRKHFSTGRYIEELQFYLQKYTNLNAEEGLLISRRQASFIYKFLRHFGLISNEISCKEDNIRHILNKHIIRKNKIIAREF